MPLKPNADGTLPMLRDADNRPYIQPAFETSLTNGAGAGATGPKGDPGPKGDKGDQGIQGLTGQTGSAGTNGTNGTQGIQGIKGDTGLQGIQGVKGNTGADGPQGPKGDTGQQGIQGIQGVKGDAGTAGTTPVPVFATLANDTLALALGTNSAVKLTVTANRTLTTTVPAAGTEAHVIVLTSGTSSFTITFGSGFKPVGTLATGTTSARVFVVNFISDGTNLYESGRTAAMVA